MLLVACTGTVLWEQSADTQQFSTELKLTQQWASAHTPKKGNTCPHKILWVNVQTPFITPKAETTQMSTNWRDKQYTVYLYNWMLLHMLTQMDPENNMSKRGVKCSRTLWLHLNEILRISKPTETERADRWLPGQGQGEDGKESDC